MRHTTDEINRLDDPGEHHDVVVVGGGQAGLAIGYHLAQQGREFTILEAAEEPAAAWRARWDSLRLFTPVRYSGLPGLPFPGDPDSYPGRDDVVDYLTEYARRFDLPVEYGSRVRAISRSGRAYVVEVEDSTYTAAQVVIATGPFQLPFVPPIAAELGSLPPERFTCRSDRGRRRYLSGSSDATCSGISRSSGRCASRPTRGSVAAWRAETR